MARPGMTHVRHYFDYKSPYAFLAQAATSALAAEPGITVEWLPYTLQIPKYLGDAALDAEGRDMVGTRNDHQWRRVRYAYMDCRREANRRGLVIRGPRRIFDSSLAHIAFLFVQTQGAPQAFHAACFDRFWRRELDLESSLALSALMRETGYDANGFDAYAAGQGREAYEHLQTMAERTGVFGVPSWMVGDELYWGLERLERVYEQAGLIWRGGTAPSSSSGF